MPGIPHESSARLRLRALTTLVAVAAATALLVSCGSASSNKHTVRAGSTAARAATTRRSARPLALPASLRGTEWTRLPTTRRIVALTFDAGGNDAGVAAILSTLRSTGTPATFFLTGHWAQYYPAAARRIAARYPVGDHTWTHPDLTTLSDAQIRRQVLKGAQLIRAATGRDTRPLFRFPYGARNARTIRLSNALGYGDIRWTVDTLGWMGTSGGQSAQSVVSRVLSNLQPGEIVLMHVGSNPKDNSTLDATALPVVIHDLRQRGFRFVTVAQVVRSMSPDPTAHPKAPSTSSPAIRRPPRLPASLVGAEWRRLPTTRKVVALTFDAGNNNGGVSSILATLRATGTPATFFLNGRWAQAYPADALRIAASYSIGNHSADLVHFRALTDAQARRQILEGARMIKTVTGRDPRPWFRSPFGDLDARTIRLANSLGYGSIFWTVGTQGYLGASAGQSVSSVVDRVLRSLQPGEIVIMEVQANTSDHSTLDADALPTVIQDVKRRGYHFVGLDQFVRSLTPG